MRRKHRKGSHIEREAIPEVEAQKLVRDESQTRTRISSSAAGGRSEKELAGNNDEPGGSRSVFQCALNNCQGFLKTRR